MFFIGADTHRALKHTRNHHLCPIWAGKMNRYRKSLWMRSTNCKLLLTSNICLLVRLFGSMEPEDAVKHSTTRTFLLRFGQSGGSGRGRSPSGSAPPAWWGRWSAPDTGDSWQSAAPAYAVSSPASAETHARKWTQVLVSPPFALSCLLSKAATIRPAGVCPRLQFSLGSRERRHENKHRDSTGILDRMLWMLIKKTACKRNPVKVCKVIYSSETENRRN